MRNFLDAISRRFEVKARGSSLRTEVVAGLTTFATMSYVLVVHPKILGAAGMDVPQLISVTAFAAAFFSIDKLAFQLGLGYFWIHPAQSF